MIVTCPSCRAKFSLEAAQDDTVHLAFADAYSRIPKAMKHQALRYIALFRPKKSAMSWERAARLAEQLAGQIESGRVQAGGNPARPAPPDIWRQGIEKMIDHPPKTLPLSNHNYLFKIVWELADQADAQAEYQRNRSERDGETAARLIRERQQAEPLDRDFMRKVREEARKHAGHTAQPPKTDQPHGRPRRAGARPPLPDPPAPELGGTGKANPQTDAGGNH